jgi:hypothetical protein
MPRVSPAPHQTPIGVVLRGLLARRPSLSWTIDRNAGVSTERPGISPLEHALEASLRRDVQHLAGTIGERNVWRPTQLREAEEWLLAELLAAGLVATRHPYRVKAAPGIDCVNIDATIAGTTVPGEIVVVGAHYDAVRQCPAANDNGTGVAATLAVARHFVTRAGARSLRIVLFVNEEPPFFWTDEMGSLVYARACKARDERIVAMITPETIGCYRDEPGSQSYPAPLGAGLPDAGNFIAMLGMSEAGPLLRRCLAQFRRSSALPAIGAALPAFIPGVGASDHWSFWRTGVPALMMTDTAPFRDANYHMPTDTPEKIDYPRTARAVAGLLAVVDDLLNGSSIPT